MNANNKTAHYFSWGLTFIFLILLAGSLHLVAGGDDKMFTHILDGKQIFPLLHKRYQEWSGRVPVEALLISTINIKLFWKMAIPLSILLLSYTAWRAFFLNTLKAGFSIPAGIALFMLITPSVNADASWWITGFYNYLLPVALGSWSLVILRNSNTCGSLTKSTALATLLISCFSEQVAFLMLVSALSIYLIKKERNYFDIIFLILSFLFTAFLLTAPGNACRFTFEVKNSLPEFANYNLINKVMLGIDRLNHHINDPSNLLINITFSLAIFNFFRKKKATITEYLATMFLMIKIIGFLLAHLNSSIADFIYNKNFFTAQSWFGYKIYTSCFFTLAAIFSLLYLSNIVLKDKKEALVVTVSLLAGCASIMMIGFSPTVYASAQRVLFTFEICSLVVLCLYIKHTFLAIKPY